MDCEQQRRQRYSSCNNQHLEKPYTMGLPNGDAHTMPHSKSPGTAYHHRADQAKPSSSQSGHFWTILERLSTALTLAKGCVSP